MPTQTPIYDQLLADSDWTPDQLRAPYDVTGAVAASYALVAQRQWTRRHLRQLIRQRQRIQKTRRQRRTPLP